MSGTFRGVHASPDAGTVAYGEFAEVALRYVQHIQSTARRLSANAADADDLVQDTYLLALQHYRELRSLAHCRAWLYRILRRQTVTRYRRLHSESALVLGSGGADGCEPSPRLASHDDDPCERLALQEIRNAIMALPSDLRIAVTLRDIEGFTYTEIAHLTDCPVGTVRSRIARARARLMTALRDHAEACGIRRPAA
jgi:RNA polymerase sigma-70 factor, ECF subfamily